MLFGCGHPHFGNFDSAVIIDEEAIHIKLYPNNINRDGGIKISEAWMPTKWTYEEITSASQNNNEDRNAPRTERHKAPMTKHQSTTYTHM